MKTFVRQFVRFVLIIFVPISILLILYLYFDPFKVVYNYEDYSMDGKYNYVTANSDFVATQIYLKNYKTQNYNSYIFGNSRTLAFNPKEWAKYISNSSKIFVFNANEETLFGILGKLKFIEKKGADINNALVLLDARTLREVENSTGHLFIKHPAISGESWIDFHASFFNAFLSHFFFIKYIDYTFLKKYRLYMTGAIDIRKIPIDKITNEPTFLFFEEDLKDSLMFYKKNASIFYNRPEKEVEGDLVIDAKSFAMLEKIKKSFERNKTDYKIIINPLYDQVKLNKKDIEKLKNIFGAKNIYDFSGKNSYTNNIGYYYETSHFRPTLGALLLYEIYKKGY